MLRPLALLGALVLLLGPALVAGLPGGLPAAGAELVVAAPAELPAGLTFNVTASNGSARLQAVVTHEDPDGGAVVDRVVPLDLAENTTARVEVEGVRFATNLSVSLVAADVDLPRLPGVELLDAVNVSALPSLARAPLPPVFADRVAGNVSVVPYEIGRGGAPRLVTTSQGCVVVGYVAGDEVTLKVSADGGHTWSRGIVPIPFQGIASSGQGAWYNGSATRWRLAALPDGRVEVGESLLNYTGTPGPDGQPRQRVDFGMWRLAFLDPATLAVTRADLGATRRLEFDVNTYELLPLRDGTVLFVFHGGVTERDASGAAIASWPFDRKLRVWAIAPDGTTSERATIPLPDGTMHSFMLDRNEAGRIALVAWSHERGSPTTNLPWWVVSDDDGRTFSAPRVVDDAFPAQGWFLIPGSMRLSPTGAIHLATIRDQEATRTAVTEIVRIAPGAPTVVTRLEPAHPGWGMGALELARKGSHLWLMGIAFNPSLLAPADRAPDERWGMESLDDGLTWGPRYTLREPDGSSPADVDAGQVDARQSMDPLPDGGPILLGYHDDLTRSQPMLVAIPMFDAMPALPSLTRVTTRPLVAGDLAPTRTLASVPVPSTPVATTPQGTTPAPPAPGPEAAPSPDLAKPLAGAALGAAAVAVGVGVAATEAGRFLAGKVASALYSRLSRGDVLAHDVRAAIHAHVARHPGIRYERLRRDLALANGALAFHLRVLLREGFLVAHSDWGRRSFHVAGGALPPSPPSDARGRVLRLLAARDEAGAAEVAAAAGMSRQLARYHLQALVREGMVEAREGGRYARTPRASTVTFERVG